MIDDLRKVLRDLVRGLLRIHAELLRELRDAPLAEHFEHMLRGDRQVPSGADPPLYLLGEARLVALREQPGKAAVVLGQTPHHREDPAWRAVPGAHQFDRTASWPDHRF